MAGICAEDQYFVLLAAFPPNFLVVPRKSEKYQGEIIELRR